MWPSKSPKEALLHVLDVLVQTALVPGSFVLVDDALVGHAVNFWGGCYVGSAGHFFVASCNRDHDFLDGSAQARTLLHVVSAACDVLPVAFLG